MALLGPNNFFGEGVLAEGSSGAWSSASTMANESFPSCEPARQGQRRGCVACEGSQPFSAVFVQYLLSRNIRIEEDLVDQLFNSSEKRLARVLLLLANFGTAEKPELVIPKVSQETLAEIVGTTRSRVSFFMNRFRKLGFIEYNGELEGE